MTAILKFKKKKRGKGLRVSSQSNRQVPRLWGVWWELNAGEQPFTSSLCCDGFAFCLLVIVSQWKSSLTVQAFTVATNGHCITFQTELFPSWKSEKPKEEKDMSLSVLKLPSAGPPTSSFTDADITSTLFPLLNMNDFRWIAVYAIQLPWVWTLDTVTESSLRGCWSRWIIIIIAIAMF